MHTQAPALTTTIVVPTKAAQVGVQFFEIFCEATEERMMRQQSNRKRKGACMFITTGKRENNHIDEQMET